MLNMSSLATRLKREWEKQGVEIKPFTPEEKKARDERLKKQWLAAARKKELQNWHKESLWSGDRAIHFTFNDWKPADRKNSKLAAELGNRAYLLANQMQKEGINVFMVGEPGTGKTSLALAMADRAERKFGKKYLFISTMELPHLFNRIYRRDYEADERLNRLYKKAKSAPILIIDDFGTETGMRKYDNQDGGYKATRTDLQEWLYRLADARYNVPGKSTIITSNYLPQELLQMYNPKLISRLLPKAKEKNLNFKGLEDMRK